LENHLLTGSHLKSLHVDCFYCEKRDLYKKY
jgi:hypothetical protein